jgi:hypothetical protein
MWIDLINFPKIAQYDVFVDTHFLVKKSVYISFDAFGKLSSWKFYGNGSASFTTKYLQSDFYRKSVDKNDIVPYLMFESVNPPFGTSVILLFIPGMRLTLLTNVI